MRNLSTWSKTNIIFSFIILLVAFLAPILMEKFVYGGKIQEAESVCTNIANKQSELYAIKNEYTQVKKSNQSLLTTMLGIRNIDLKHYDYTVTTTTKSFKIVVEPKVKFLKERTIPPQVYTYTHLLDGADSKKWSSL